MGEPLPLEKLASPTSSQLRGLLGQQTSRDGDTGRPTPTHPVPAGGVDQVLPALSSIALSSLASSQGGKGRELHAGL